jgi:hypothetical protein
VTEVSWSRCDGGDCVRVRGLAPGADVQVRPRPARAIDRDLPPMAGQLVGDGDGDDDGVCFVPRFPFVEGTTYTIAVGGIAVAVLHRRVPNRLVTTRVLDIHPTAVRVPRNLLRLYVRFSAPMSAGYAAAEIRLVDEAGHELPGALLPAEYELWDGSRRRLTILLDPARIKRGLAGHRQAGYPIRSGQPFRLVVGDGLRDARGARLAGPAERRYEVGADERRHVEPATWALTVPVSGTQRPLTAEFGRPLDFGLLARCLRVIDPGGQVLDGTPGIGPQERSWQLTPRQAWAPGPHQLVVEPVLEDLAGNSVSRVFDRDLRSPQDEPREAAPVTVPFRVR